MVYAFAAATFFSTLVGGVVALRARDKLHLVLGLAAGVMLGVVALDLLPEALELAGKPLFGVPGAMLAALGGFFTIHIVERWLAIHRGHEQEFGGHSHADAHVHARSPGPRSVGVLAGGGLVLHSLLDGVGIGVAFQAGEGIGIAAAVAVIAHDFADGFNTYTLASLYGNDRRRSLTLLACDAVAPVVGVMIGSLLPVSRAAVGLYLGYFAGFLLYLATSDILPEAHARHPSRLTLAFTVAGAALMWLVVGLTN